MNDMKEQLKENIKFYQYHESYLPFIGDEYEKYKILQIGETHYLNQSDDLSVKDDYSFDYFENWYNYEREGLHCEEIHKDKNYWRSIDTNWVLNNWINGKPFEKEHGIRRLNHSIFRDYIKAFSEGVLGEKIDTLSVDDSEKTGLYKYSAYTDFYSFPCVIGTGSVWEGLFVSYQKKLGKSELNDEELKELKVYYDNIVKKSTEIIDQVIDIIKPRTIVFMSKNAWDEYERNYGKHSKDNNIIHVAHPEYWSRNKTVNNKEILVNGLKKIYG